MNNASAYTHARTGAAFVSLPDRAVLAATGPQRQKFLHSMLSNAIEGKNPGQGTLAALMDVKGHLSTLLRALVTPDAVLLEMPASRVKAVEETLLFYKVGAPVRFAARDTSVLAVVGPGARQALAEAGVETGDLALESHVSSALGGVPALVARAGDMPAGGYVVHVAPKDEAAVDTALASAGAARLDRTTLDVLRIEDGRPWYGPDVTAENILHETGVLREYHSPTKGCYLGQEVVARLEGRGGNVNKMMRGLQLQAPVAAGALVRHEGRDVGRVTTAGVSPRLGPIALAYVHRSAFEPGTAVDLDGIGAVVHALPFETAEHAA